MGVQSLEWGSQLPSSANKYLRLKQKGDNVQFKIAQKPVYTAKHFLTTEDGGWNVIECSRISSGEECEYCENYFKIMARIKKFKEVQDADDKDPEVKLMREEARSFNAAIQFYFPILDRKDEKFKILQTTGGVRNKFNAQFDSGIDVMAKEWIVRNTGSAVPSERYALSLVDSADVKPLTESEVVEFEKAKGYDLSEISNSGSNDKDDDLSI